MPQVQPLGGGAIKPMKLPGDPQNDMGMNDGNSAGPLAMPMPKPPAPQAPAMQPMQQQSQAKPQQAGAMRPPEGMPPMIRPPQAPNYQPTTPTVPGLNPDGSPNVTAPNVGTERASAGQFDVQAFRPFADAVFSEATRQLDPMMQQREADFRQRMVNQGLQEGTEAYDKAFANFTRERNDAYGSARNQALA